MTSRVDILLATYNGDPFLPAQLASLSSQSHLQSRLIARDDLSEDDTLSILKASGATLLEAKERVGCKENFSLLMRASDAPYLFFCDQDDIWKPNKIARSLQALQDAENKWGKGTPLLVHTDLEVVDANLKALSPSFWKYSGIDPVHCSLFERLLVQNTVTGCAMAINRALADLVGTIPSQAKMHDWWIALTASAFGQIVSVPAPTILYRQHSRNSIGAKKRGIVGSLKQLGNQNILEFLRKGVLERKVQGEAFFLRYGQSLDPKKRAALEAMVQADENGRLTNIKEALKHGVVRSNHLIQLARFCFKNPF